MQSSIVATAPTPAKPPFNTTIRFLAPWLPEPQALQALGGAVDHESAVKRLAEMRHAIAKRPRHVEGPSAIQALPTELSTHVESLMGSPNAAPLREEGWEVVVADLSQVRLLQPGVRVGDSRIDALPNHGLEALARVTLPLETECQLLVAPPASAHAPWTISSDNPNLSVLGPVAQNSLFGFAIGVRSSYVQVVRCRDKLVLRDGYHRAAQLVRAGITKVPVLYREFANVAEVRVNPTMIEESVVFGDRPALLRDYFDDKVSVAVDQPRTRKVLLVQVTETTIPV